MKDGREKYCYGNTPVRHGCDPTLTHDKRKEEEGVLKHLSLRTNSNQNFINLKIEMKIKFQSTFDSDNTGYK